MNQINKKSQDQEMIFIGKIMASLSHEFMNVLAIIRERSGLIEDLMALNQEATFPYQDKLAKTLTTIREQVSRGLEVGEKFNQFAHSMDEQRMQYEINDLLEMTTFLMQRFARLKKIQIKANSTDPPLTVETDPFRALLVLAGCIEYFIDRTSDGGEITLQCIKTKTKISLQILVNREECPVVVEKTIQHLQDRLRDLIERLGAQLEPLTVDKQIGLELILP